MAKAWVWILVGILAIVGVIWIADYWYNYHTTGVCWDDRGNAYPCGKAYRYSNDNYFTYSYYDNYGNKVVKSYSNYDEHNFDDYYDCYHARNLDSRYGEMLREQYGIRCYGYEAVNDNYNTNTNNRYVSEKAPIIYVK